MNKQSLSGGSADDSRATGERACDRGMSVYCPDPALGFLCDHRWPAVDTLQGSPVDYHHTPADSLVAEHSPTASRGRLPGDRSCRLGGFGADCEMEGV